MPEFIEVAKLEEIAPASARAVGTAHGTVALFNVGGRLFALADGCIRCGSSLASGTLQDLTVRCRCGWYYDVATGAVCGIGALRTDVFEVKVLGAQVILAIDAPQRDGG